VGVSGICCCCCCCGGGPPPCCIGGGPGDMPIPTPTIPTPTAEAGRGGGEYPGASKGAVEKGPRPAVCVAPAAAGFCEYTTIFWKGCCSCRCNFCCCICWRVC